MSSTQILNHTWPDDLDPETVPFATRTETVLRRRGLYNDPARFNSLTVAEVAGWWNTGPITIANLRTTAHEAIRRHHAETDLRARINEALQAVAAEPWATRISYQDPRFVDYLPKSNATVYDIATTGTAVDRVCLFNQLPNLRVAIDLQAALSLADAVAEYVESITGQHGARLRVLMARIGLSGRDPITRSDAARHLGVSYQRIYQLERQLSNHRSRTAAPAGVWMPQVTQAQRNRWPDGYTDAGIAAIIWFVSPQ